MILCLQIQKLGPHLDAVSFLMNDYQRGEPDFPDKALQWLDAVEKTMGSLRLPDGAEMSVLRGNILKVEDALWTDEEKPSRSRVRSARNAAAAAAIERAELVLRRQVQTAQERLNSFQDKLCEGLTAFALQVPIPERTGATTGWLNAVWGLLKQQDATRPLALYLSASLGAVDRLYILEGVLSRMLAKNMDETQVPGDLLAQASDTRA